MAVLKCSVCGGELDVNADMSVGVCKFCDSVITIPKALDRKGNLYNRAIFHRQNNEFDKAVEVYEDILKEDNTDAEAHWGLVLSKYGIEYVSDPKTQERIPTCHRTQAASILSDPDYLAAIEYSDVEAQRVIEKEANRINEIQAKVIEISRKEPPYDIFICYKESDELGNRTEDSMLAQDLYYELQKKGYRVFFARKTLESKLGTEYEPIIFAALSSAKVMIVLGTKAEHFNAVWVRNEWSRFNKMSSDAHKVIIPAYRGMSPYELPAELSAFQSQDMSKIGFMQDLTDGIERCLRNEINGLQEASDLSHSSAPLERLVQNSQTYLKLNNYSLAEEVYTTITKEYPEDYRGWWGLIVCKTKNFSEILLDQKETNIWFGYVRQLANQTDFEELERSYIEYTRNVSVLAATEDINSFNRTINNYECEISKISQQITAVEANIQNRIESYKQQSNRDSLNVFEAQSYLSKSELAYRKFKFIWLMIGIGMVLSLFLSIVGIYLVGVVIYISRSKNHGSKKNLVQSILNAQSNLQNAQNRQESNKVLFDKDINSMQQRIADYKNEIDLTQSKISDCQKYVELGQERISTFWFSKECEAFGVEQPLDQEILKCREIALGIREITDNNSEKDEKALIKDNDTSSIEEQLRQAVYHGDSQLIGQLLSKKSDSYLKFVYGGYPQLCITNPQKDPYDMWLEYGVDSAVNHEQCLIDCNYVKKCYSDPEDSGILPRAYQYLIHEVQALYHIDLSNDKMAEQRIREALFKSYRELRKGATVTISLPFISLNDNGPIHLDKSFSINDF